MAPGDVFLNADFGYQPPAAQNNSIGDTSGSTPMATALPATAASPASPGVTVALAHRRQRQQYADRQRVIADGTDGRGG